MKLSLLFTVLATTLVATNVDADKLNLAPILKLGLRFILLNIKKLENITFQDDIDIIIPESWKNISTGSITLKNAQIYGIETLDIADLNVEDVDPSNDNYIFNVCVNLIFDQLGFNSGYDADAGIIDEVPIYGDGEVNFAATQVVTDLCLTLNLSTDYSEMAVDDVALGLELHAHSSPSYITRFWKNDTVSDILSAIINILETIIFMWVDYEKECISSILSPIIQYAVDSLLIKDFDGTLVINSTCLEDSLGKEVGLDNLLQTLLTSFNEGTTATLISSTSYEQAKILIEKIENKVLEILHDEGFSIEA